MEFVNPVYKVERDDSEELRQKIIDMSYSEWKKMGFSKGTLHYMKQNANGKPFSLNAHVKERLEIWGRTEGNKIQKSGQRGQVQIINS